MGMSVGKGKKEREERERGRYDTNRRERGSKEFFSDTNRECFSIFITKERLNLKATRSHSQPPHSQD